MKIEFEVIYFPQQNCSQSKADIKKLLKKFRKSKSRAENKEIIKQPKFRIEAIVSLRGVKCLSCPFLATDKFLLDAHLQADHKQNYKSNPDPQDLKGNQVNLDEQDNLDDKDKLDEHCKQKVKESKTKSRGKQTIDKSRFKVSVLLRGVKCPSCPFLATHKFLLDDHLCIYRELNYTPNLELQDLNISQDNLVEHHNQDNLEEQDPLDIHCKQIRKRKLSAENVVDDEVTFKLPENVSGTVLEPEHPNSLSDQLNWKFCFELEDPRQRILAIERVKRHLFVKEEQQMEETLNPKIEETKNQTLFHKCSKCNKSYSMKSGLNRHVSMTHKKSKSSARRNPEIVPEKSTTRYPKRSIQVMKRVSQNNNKPRFQKICNTRSQRNRK